MKAILIVLCGGVIVSCSPTSGTSSLEKQEAAFFESFDDEATGSTHAIVARFDDETPSERRVKRSEGATVVAIDPPPPSPKVAAELPKASLFRTEVIVRKPLALAFRGVENGPLLLGQLDKAILPRFDLHRLKTGQKIVLWSLRGELEAFQIPVDGKALLAMKFDGAFYDSDGLSLDGPLNARPLEVSRLTSEYGTRLHPVSGRKKQHNGVDYGAKSGTPVYAIGDGRVIRALNSSTAGITLLIEHAGRYTSRYLHLAKRAPGLEIGTKVKRGERIGSVGATGKVTGPHLHFELLYDNSHVDPVNWKVTPARALTPRLKVAHQSRLSALP